MNRVKKLGLCLALAVFPLSSFATLGQPVSSVVQDKVRMKASSQLTQTQSYSVQTLTNDNNQTVYEYVNNQGIVFAVSWSGFVKPDLDSLLGQYFASMKNAKSTDHSHLNVNQSDIVISSTGRLRNFKGFAYIPAQTPAGFTLNK